MITGCDKHVGCEVQWDLMLVLRFTRVLSFLTLSFRVIFRAYLLCCVFIFNRNIVLVHGCPTEDIHVSLYEIRCENSFFLARLQ